MAPTAESAILCGDPARALAIAQHVTTGPRMSNHHRGLWGYHGRTGTGAELTVHATGIGGASAALTLGELARLGLRRAIRIGTCRALGPGHRLGEALLISAAVPADGTSAALGFAPTAPPPVDQALLTALRAEGGTDGEACVLSTDIAGGEGDGAAEVADLQSAGLLAAAAAAGVAVAVLLVVTEAGGERLEDDPLEATSLRLAETAAAALAAP